MRIVSLVPSATEMLCEIGLSDSLVGVSHECDFPPSVTKLPKVTRSTIPPNASSEEIDRLVSQAGKQGALALYTLDLSVLQALQPDVIVTQTLCDVCAVAESEVQKAAKQLTSSPRIIQLSPMSLGDVLSEHLVLGRALNCEARAMQAVDALQARVHAVAQRSQLMKQQPRVVLLEWLDPPFSAGHWTPELIRLAGAQEAIGREGAKSQRLEWSQLWNADPEVLIIACCGFSVERASHDVTKVLSLPGFRSLQAYKSNRIYIADGSAYFNRPGPRLVDSLELLAHAIDPAVHACPEHHMPFTRVSARFDSLNSVAAESE
jgi:iron complex transport system substrate-binding protein